ncbi:hypothetical protein L0694_003183 [Escherichia coli]|nr:hypothetical protein [Escherichia coli]
MMKSDEKYQVPAWMRPLLPLLCNTGGNDPEELLNDTETTASANVVRYVLIVAAYFHERRSLNNFHRDRVITFEQIAE